MIKVFLHILSCDGITDADCLFQIRCKTFFDCGGIIFFKSPAEAFQFPAVFSGFRFKPFPYLSDKYPLDLSIWNDELCYSLTVFPIPGQISCREKDTS